MKLPTFLKLTFVISLVFFGLWVLFPQQPSSTDVAHSSTPSVEEAIHVDAMVQPARAEVDSSAVRLGRPKLSFKVQTAVYETAKDPGSSTSGVFIDDAVELCQGACEGDCGVVYADGGAAAGGFVQSADAHMPSKSLKAVGPGMGFREARWAHARTLPWEQYSFGEYVGPFRTPHVPEYRLRVGDQLEFVYLVNRRQSTEAYRFFVGDEIQITSAGDPNLNQPSLRILSDGTVSLPLIGIVRIAGKTIVNLQRELNDRYADGFVKNPEIVVQVIQGDTPLQDIRDAVDARQGAGGQSRLATVSPDGTVQLPLVGSVPAVGLSLNELGREVNARYRIMLGGIEVTPILIERAERFARWLCSVAMPTGN